MIKECYRNVIDFLFWNESLVYLKGRKLKERTLFVDHEPLFNNTGDFYILGDLLLVSTWNPNTYLMDLRKKKTLYKFEGYSCSTKSLTEEGFFLTKKVNGERRKNIYSFTKKTILPIDTYPKYLYKDNTLEISRFSEYEIFENFNKWYFKTLNPIVVNKVIGVHKELLYLAQSNFNLVALNTKTGKLIWEINPNINFDSKGTVLEKQTFSLKLDNENDCLIHPYLKVSLKGKITHFNYLQQLSFKDEGDWAIKGNGIFDFNNNYLIFTATKKFQATKESEFIFESYIIVVDRIKDSILYKLSLNKGTNYKDVKKILARNNLLYVLDYGGTLSEINLNKKGSIKQPHFY